MALLPSSVTLVSISLHTLSYTSSILPGCILPSLMRVSKVIFAISLLKGSNEDITIEITPKEGLSAEYQIGGIDGEWIEYTEPITVSENTTIYFRNIKFLIF